MKQSIKLLLGGAFLLSLPMFLTSCEDILGEWSKPTPVNVTPDDGGGGTTSSNQYLIYSYSGGTTSSTPENIPDGATTDATLTNTWSGTIVITADKTLTGDVTLASDVNLIIKDGVELKINAGQILGGGATNSDYSLKIYGQTESTGKLTIDADGGVYNICVKSLDIHGCVISATNSNQAIEAAANEDIKIYHGDITAIGKMTGLMGGWPGNIDIYGGKLTAKATTNGMGISGNTFTLYDGTVIATGSDAVLGLDIDGFIGIMVTDISVKKGSLTATGGNAVEGNNNGGVGINGNVTIDGGTVEATGGNGYGTGTGGIGISGTTITINNCTKVTATGGDGATKGECFSGTVTPANTLKYSWDDGASYTNSDGSAQTFSMITSLIIIPQ